MTTKILVIDDNIALRENTAEILQLAGYETQVAENGRQGWEIALHEKPDLIICDIMMPELDGYGLLHLLRKNQELQYIPFIFLTAKTERSDLRKGMELGADDYVTKPFEDVELLTAVEVRLKKSKVLSNQYGNDAQGFSQFLDDVRDQGLLKNISDNYPRRSFRKKQELYRVGNRPRYVYYLLTGKVKIFRLHEDGKEYITDLCKPGDFIGFVAVIQDCNYDNSAIILEDAEVMQIPREDFLVFLQNDINIAAKFIQMISQNVKSKEDRLLSLAYSSVRKRVAKTLLDIHHKYNQDEQQAVIEFTRDDLAQYVGTATESLIRTLSDFKSEGLIDIVEGKISILDEPRLAALIG